MALYCLSDLPKITLEYHLIICLVHMTFIYCHDSRCQRLIDEGINPAEDSSAATKDKEGTAEPPVLVYLHSLGAAIPRALNLALQLQK